MTKKINKTVWTVLALTVLAALLLLLAPQALADSGEDNVENNAADKITIDANGTVTLLSGHIAGEKVSSMQVSFTVGEDSVFTFGDVKVGRTVKQSADDNGVLTIYISGTEPLIGENSDRVVLGTFTNSQSVRPVEDSLAYVYGHRVIFQTLDVLTLELTPREQLQELVQRAEKLEEAERKEPLTAALAAAKELLENEEASEESINKAIQDLQAALDGQASEAGNAAESLQEAIDAADAFATSLTAPLELYTEESWNAFLQARADATNAKDSGDANAMENARAALVNAQKNLKTIGQAALESALARAAEELSQGTYTDESVSALNDAIKAAEDVLARSDATEEERKAAAQAVEDAIEALSKVPDSGGVIGGDDPESTAVPTTQPTAVPTTQPTAVPTTQPTAVPSEQPTAEPSEQPTAEPSEQPTAGPSEQPTAGPSEQPTAVPSVQPSAQATPTAASTVPNTGDETVLLPWIAVLCLAGAMLTVLTLRRGKTRH